MQPGTYNFSIYEGETFAETWTRSGVTTATGWSAKLDIRAKAEETSTQYLELTSSSGLTLSSNGTVLSIAVLMTAAQTTAMGALAFKKAYYDLKLTKPDTTVEYLLKGTITFTQRVTP
jgi:hypothetical protein